MPSSHSKPNYLKGHLILLVLDALGIGSYYGFAAYSELSTNISGLEPEVVIDRGPFFTFLLLAPVLVHFLVILDLHAGITKLIDTRFFYAIGMAIIAITLFSTPYVITNNFENRLRDNDYIYCASLSYTSKYKSTHFTWRKSDIGCDVNHLNPGEIQ